MVRRVILNETDEGCPCGGTHVHDIKHIQAINVVKVNKKKDRVKMY
eukprot:CAMPEP_0116993514 /NCGR_PEP_ID=MMETSP0467-20121206/67522_1 /TAXON_ID=283647 /ORGANISM="Mesodinium pulex, Strain SPMC105" /LENGTH=45 /DNA_ID= /DNA_START= /DNA_END= /DNA_ORIENTATION=